MTLLVFQGCQEKKLITEEVLFGKSEQFEISQNTKNASSNLESSKSLMVFKRKKRRNSRNLEDNIQVKKTSDGREYYLQNGDTIFLPPLLPEKFAERDFLKLTNTRDINDLAGGLVKLISEDSDEKLYQLASLGRFALDTEIPENLPIENGIVYQQKIDKTVNFAGSYLVANVNVSANSLKEIIITDVARANIELGAFDEQRLKTYYDGLPQDKKDNLFIIKSVTLTTITHKELFETSFDGGADGGFFKVGSKYYSTQGNFQTDRVISADVINLKDIF